MKKENCLIAGLPESGKSTFLGALWFNLKREKINKYMHLKADTNLPDDIAQLNSLSNAWRDAKDIDRTSGIGSIDRVKLNLVRADTQEKFSLDMPDFRGEVFKNILQTEESDLLQKWLSEADYLIYFIKDFKNGEFDDDDNHDDDESENNEDIISPLTIDDISAAAQNIMVLKYLLAHGSFNKVAIFLSCWDLYTNDGKLAVDPENYLKQNSPGLYNYIKYHIKNCKIYGISSQGSAYPSKEVNQNEKDFEIVRKEFRDKLTPYTSSGKRAFVEYENKIMHDISFPIFDLIAK